MVSRRAFTTTLGAIGSLGAAYYVVTAPPSVDVDVDVGGVVNQSKEAAEGALSDEPDNPWDQTFNSPLVDRIQFDDDGAMHVTFAPNHGLDSFGVWHATDDWNDRDPVYQHQPYGGQEMPRYSGTVTVNIGAELRNISANFPSNKFKLIGLARFSLRWEHDGKVKFFVPKALMP